MERHPKRTQHGLASGTPMDPYSQVFGLHPIVFQSARTNDLQKARSLK